MQLILIPVRDRTFRYANETNDIQDVVLSIVDKVEAIYERDQKMNWEDEKEFDDAEADPRAGASRSRTPEADPRAGVSRSRTPEADHTHTGLTALLGRMRLSVS
jgi:hypothetical protein